MQSFGLAVQISSFGPSDERLHNLSIVENIPCRSFDEKVTTVWHDIITLKSNPLCRRRATDVNDVLHNATFPFLLLFL